MKTERGLKISVVEIGSLATIYASVTLWLLIRVSVVLLFGLAGMVILIDYWHSRRGKRKKVKT